MSRSREGGVRLSARARRWLSDLILAALRDEGTRRSLEAIARGGACGPGIGGTRSAGLDGAQRAELAARAARAWEALRDLPLGGEPPALSGAGRLFDAGLYFEAHEALEAQWRAAAGEERLALQGLIQIAVGFQHLADGNRAGARSLLLAGSSKVCGRRLGALHLDAFAGAARECARRLEAGETPFRWSTVPRFPGPPVRGPRGVQRTSTGDMGPWNSD